VMIVTLYLHLLFQVIRQMKILKWDSWLLFLVWW
jgi:hypothetical protein